MRKRLIVLTCVIGVAVLLFATFYNRIISACENRITEIVDAEYGAVREGPTRDMPTALLAGITPLRTRDGTTYFEVRERFCTPIKNEVRMVEF